MKRITVAAAAATLTIAACMGASASAQTHSNKGISAHSLSILVHIPMKHRTITQHVMIPLQTGVTATPTSEPAPTPSPTQSPYPDPTTLLTNAFNSFEALKGIHFQYVVTGDETNVEHLTINATGKANCTAQMTTVTARDTLLSTNQKASEHYEFIQKGKKYYKKPLSGSKQTWRSVKLKDVSPAGFEITNPLVCPSTTTSGGGSGSGNQTPLVNQGPLTYHGTKVWDITTTLTDTSQGDTIQENYDFYVSQDRQLLFGIKATVLDPSQNVTVSEEEIHSQLGTKVSVPTPKSGSKTP